jgi:hypothetical protein
MSNVQQVIVQKLNDASFRLDQFSFEVPDNAEVIMAIGDRVRVPAERFGDEWHLTVPGSAFPEAGNFRYRVDVVFPGAGFRTAVYGSLIVKDS